MNGYLLLTRMGSVDDMRVRPALVRVSDISLVDGDVSGCTIERGNMEPISVKESVDDVARMLCNQIVNCWNVPLLGKEAR